MGPQGTAYGLSLPIWSMVKNQHSKDKGLDLIPSTTDSLTHDTLCSLYACSNLQLAIKKPITSETYKLHSETHSTGLGRWLSG